MSSKRPRIYMAGIIPPEEDPVKRIEHTLSSAQLLALKASPVQLLPSPGPGKFYFVHNALLILNAGATPYTVPPTAFVTLDLSNYFQPWFSATSFFSSAVDLADIAGGRDFQGLMSALADLPLKINLDAATEMTLGNGTATIVVYYTIEDAP